LVAKAAEQFSRLPVVWLHFAECTGCSEALLRTSYPNIDSILLDTISLEYHETLMAAAGYQAEQNLEKALADFNGKFICVIEGALPRGMDGKYLTLGAKGKTGIQVAREVTSKAAAVICIGSCSSFGNVQAAESDGCRGNRRDPWNQDGEHLRLSSEPRKLCRHPAAFPAVRRTAGP
jgi:quinone-reactive Ni/Fe-hydrogenase small subunit